MDKTTLRLAACSALVTAVCATSPVTATAASLHFDVAADWSDVINPNGAWSYEVNGALASSATRTGDTVGTAPALWGPGGNSFVGWSRSNGTELFAHDWEDGQVFGHSP